MLSCTGTRAAAVFLVSLLVSPSEVLAQAAGSVTGTVTTEETGEPLQGATVTIENAEGVSLGTLTDQDGRFLIVGVVPGSYEVEVRLLGYAERMIESITVASGQTVPLDTQLEPQAIGLAELVVVGYGEQRRATVTGSVSSVSGAELTETPVANLANALAGRAAGVVVNNRSGIPGDENTTILVRGRQTLGDAGASSPLIVIDGVPGRGSFERLNPEDVESLTILKDASAAIYGAQAANGVILVTTKTGAAGPPQFTYTANFGRSAPTYRTDMVDSWDFATYLNELNESLGQGAVYTDEQIELFRSGTDPINYPNTHWLEEITRSSAPQTDHRLDVSGSAGQFQYFLSGQYLFQDGIFKNSAVDYTQYNLRSNVQGRLHENLDVSLRLSGRFEDRNESNFGTNGIFTTAAANYPVVPAYYPNGLPSTGIENNNPAARAEGRTGFEKDKRYFFNSTLNFRLDLPSIMEGLYVSGLGAADLRHDDVKNMTRTFDQVEFDQATGEYVDRRDRTGPTFLGKAFANELRRTANIRIGLDRAVGRHLIQAFAAHERSQFDENWVAASRTGFPSEAIEELFPGSTEEIDNNSGANKRARAHYFGRLSYSFDDKYMAEFTLRHDASDRFPPEGRWGTFPGVSGAWRISQEPFFNASAVNDLKLKASWGRMGNDSTDAYQFLTRFNPNQTAHIIGETPGRIPGLSPEVEPNPGITWETVDKYNVGVEATLWDGTLGLEFNVFYDDRSGILVSRSASVPFYTGLSLPEENLGQVTNRGFDGFISYRPTIGDFQLELSPNFTYARSRIDFMDEALDTPEWQRQEGHQVGSLLLYQSCGIYSSQADIDAWIERTGRRPMEGTGPGDICLEATDTEAEPDSRIGPRDQVRHYDSATPRFQYGLTTGVNRGGLSLDLVWQGQHGARVRIMPQAINAPVTPPKWLFDGRWTEDNPDAEWPRSFDRRNLPNAVSSTFWWRSSAYLRLKSAQLSYTLPEQVTSRLNLSNLRIHAQGFNLFTVFGISGYDPETNVQNTYNYTQQRTFSLGFSATP